MIRARAFRVLVVLAVCGLASAVSAREENDIGFHGVGLTFGYVSPSDLDPTIMFGANADLGTIAEKLTLVPSFLVWQSEAEVEGYGGRTTTLEVREIGLLLDAKYYLYGDTYGASSGGSNDWSSGGVADGGLYFGGGLGFYFSDVTNESLYASDSEGGSDLGFDFLFGYERMTSEKLYLFAEGRYKFNGFDSFQAVVGFTFRIE